jgi:hypothetical protein
MTNEQPTPSTATPTDPLGLGWVKLLSLVIAVTLLVGVLSLYLQPSFLVTLASQVWACF